MTTWTTWRTASVTGAALAACSGAGAAAAYTRLLQQAATARAIIGRDTSIPPHADGLYEPGAPVRPWVRGTPYDVHLMIFGDSTAAGLGSTRADQVPGVRIARGLADRTGQRVRLSTKAIQGATSKGLTGQLDAMFIVGPAPDAAVILVGANDVTKKISVARAAGRLGAAVARLRAGGATVVVGTCPDLGVVPDIPQPLRSLVRQWGRSLARAQFHATLRAGGTPVRLGDLAEHFYASPDVFLGADRFHPSGEGYALAAEKILPALIDALERDRAADAAAGESGTSGDRDRIAGAEMSRSVG